LDKALDNQLLHKAKDFFESAGGEKCDDIEMVDGAEEPEKEDREALKIKKARDKHLM
jgi:hypothetical protein